MFSSNSKEYKYIPPIFAFISIFLAYGLSRILHLLNVNYWFIDFPSVWGFYWILNNLYSKHIWKKKLLLLKTPLSKTPNLNGSWYGEIQSNYNNENIKIPFTAEIFQDWDKMSIILETVTSKSFSSNCVLSFSSPEGIYLTYCYLNKPKNCSPETMNMHTGINELKISKDKLSMSGDYFTGRGRSTFGRINFNKKE